MNVLASTICDFKSVWYQLCLVRTLHGFKFEWVEVFMIASLSVLVSIQSAFKYMWFQLSVVLLLQFQLCMFSTLWDSNSLYSIIYVGFQICVISTMFGFRFVLFQLWIIWTLYDLNSLKCGFNYIYFQHCSLSCEYFKLHVMSTLDESSSMSDIKSVWYQLWFKHCMI